MDGTRKNPVVAADWHEAFSVCRDRQKPIVVAVKNEIAKIYPSGRADMLTKQEAE